MPRRLPHPIPCRPHRRRRLEVGGIWGISLFIILLLFASCGASGTTGGNTASSRGTVTPTGGTGTPTGTASPGASATQTAAPTPTKTTAPGQPQPPTATPTTPPPKPLIHQVLAQKTLTGTGLDPVVVSCPSGELPLGGGWATSPSDGSGVRVEISWRTGPSSWIVYARHSGTTLVNAYVECLKNASGASATETALIPGTVGANTYSSQQASCGAGQMLVGGGFGVDPGVTAYEFTNLNSYWALNVQNHNGSSAQFGVVAECLSYAGAHSSPVLAPTHTSGAVATCPNGSAVSSGGYITDQNSVVFTTDTSGNGWTAYVSPSSASINVYATCLSFS